MGAGKSFMIECQSPYYIHFAEGPGVAITLVVFNGKNYDMWQKVVRIALKAKKNLGSLNLKKPTINKGDDPSVIQVC